MRKKKERFRDNAQAPNLLEEGKPSYDHIRGQWHAHFHNEHPITLELGCGRGSYTIALASRRPAHNYIGIDIKGARLWAGSQQALRDNLQNVAFLRTDITFLNHFFAPGEITDIYIPFPDPHPRDHHGRKRLTSPHFLALYATILTPKGTLHLKTDDQALFAYTQQTIHKSPFQINIHHNDLYTHLPEHDIHCQIQTTYEKRFLAQGKKIAYLQASLP